MPRGKEAARVASPAPGPARGAQGHMGSPVAQHRPAARGSHSCHWPLQLLPLSNNPRPPSPPRRISYTTSGLDLSSPQLPPCQGGMAPEVAAPRARPDPAPHLRSPLGRASRRLRSWEERPLHLPFPPGPLPWPCFNANLFKKWYLLLNPIYKSYFNM